MRWSTCPPDRLPRCPKTICGLIWPPSATTSPRCSSSSCPDIVHAHFWMSGWAAARAVRRLSRPLVVTFHALGSVKRRYQGPADTSPLNRVRVEVAVAEAADRIVATATEEVRELALLGVPGSKVSVVPCGVDLEHFTPAPTTNVSPSAPKRRCRYRLLRVGR